MNPINQAASVFRKWIYTLTLANKQPKDFDEFLKLLEKSGCKIRLRGKTLSISPPGATRYFRLKSGQKGMPEGYDEKSLRRKITEMQAEIKANLRDDYTTGTENIIGGVKFKRIFSTRIITPTQPLQIIFLL